MSSYFKRKPKKQENKSNKITRKKPVKSMVNFK